MPVTTIPTDLDSIVKIRFDNNGNISPTGNNTIYDLEKKAYDSLNKLLNIGAQYIRCTADIGSNLQKSCDATYKNKKESEIKQEVLDKYADYELHLSNLKIAFNNIKEQIGDTVDISTILSKYKDMIQKRNELDLKIMELNKEDNSRFVSYKSQYDSTIYSSILVTVLATSLVYYIFIKL